MREPSLVENILVMTPKYRSVLEVKTRIGYVADGLTGVGLLLVAVGFWLWGVVRVGFLSFLVMWIAWILFCLPKPAFMLLAQKDYEVRRRKWLIIGSWVLLIGSAVASTAYVLLFPPDWSKYTGIGTDARNSPYIITLYATAPAVFAWWFCYDVEGRKRGRKYLGQHLREYIKRS